MSRMERLGKTSSVEAAEAAFRAMTTSYLDRGAPLYAALSACIADEPELLAIASHGLATAPSVHFFAAVQYLLLGDPHDPLAQYYGSLTEAPAPPEQAFPAFVRFCGEHRETLLQLLGTRTIQTTEPERCQATMPALSLVARRVGEPLNLIEIGCSAGVLLTFDKYAYQLKGRSLLGSIGAPLTFEFDVEGGPELHVPKIGQRIGVDLRPVDVRSADERRWILAFCHPDKPAKRERLATALDVVANADIDMVEGDALDLLAGLIAKTPGPLCIYHSACTVFWSPAAKAELDLLLADASLGREFYRVGVELPERQPAAAGSFTETTIAHYRDGAVDSKVVAKTSGSWETVTWLD